MKLNSLSWDAFFEYLVLERNYKNNKANIAAVKFRFFAIKKHFSEIEFNRDNFRSYLGELSQTNKGATLNKYITIARRIEEFLGLSLGLKRFAYRSEKPADFVALTVEETEAIANVNVPYKKMRKYLNLRNKILYLLSGTNGGNRISEALNLKWCDVLNSPKPHLVFRDTKSRKDRKVYLAPRLWDLIQQLPMQSEYVFVSFRGGQLNIQEVNLDLRRRAAMCGIEKYVHYHLLRHTYATQMCENPDISPMDIADVMGFTDPRTILERYKKSSLSHMAEVMLSHPSIRGEKTPEMVGKQLIKAVMRTVDTAVNPVDIQQENGEMVIRIKNLKAAKVFG